MIRRPKSVLFLFLILIFILVFRSQVCVEAFAKCETIPPLKRAMNLREDLIYPCCETFSTIFQGHHDSLVKQVKKDFWEHKKLALYRLLFDFFVLKMH